LEYERSETLNEAEFIPEFENQQTRLFCLKNLKLKCKQTK